MYAKGGKDLGENEFLLDIITVLNQQLSKKKIKEQLKGMDNSMFVKVISKLSITLSKRQLKKDFKQLNDLYLQVGADLKIDSALKKKLQGRIKALQDSISDLQVGVRAKDSNIAKTVTEARNKGQRVASRTSIDFNIEVKKEKAIADLGYMAKKYSKLFSNASASAKYNNILDAAYGITDAKQLANVRAQIAAFTSELKANDLASQSLGDKWKRLIDRAKDLFSAASAVTLIFSQVKQAVSSFLQLDTAMTNLYKVQDQITSRDQFSGLLTKWNKLAQNLAVTTNSLISSMEAWSKIGFNLDMSEQLAEITSIFEKTAEISNEKATSTLISAAQAFTEIDDLGVDDYVKRVEAVGDKINAIGNKYAIDSEGIADGLQNASAALKVAGNDLNETIALITATNKIYQSPEEGSNMLKVASMRLRGQVDALKEMSEDAEGVSTDLTKIQQQVYELTGNKVNIFEDDENLKSTYQMILEIGEVFDSLNDRSQADLLEVMFGKQRASAGASLLLNYEELEKIKNDSMNAANSMAEEYSKYMESASASLTIFKEKLIETYSTFMSGDLIKYTADMGSGLLDLVNSTDLLRHSLVGIVSLNIGKGITSVGASIASTVKQMNTLGNALQQVKNLPVDKVLRKESLQELGKETLSLTEKNLKLLLSQKQLNDSDKIRILKAQDLSKEEAKLKLEKMGLLSATKQQTAANVAEAATTGTLKNAMLSLKATAKEVGATIKGIFASNPIGMGLMLVTTIFSVATTAISKHNEKLEETRRANIESATTASENADKLKDLYNEYTRLASIQDRTTSEEEAFKTAVENITVALGDKAKALENLTAGTDEYADALARATKEELQSQAVTATIGRKSAEEELQGKTWDKWGGSQVSIDSNSKGKSLSDETQRAVGIVSESLKEYETINRTWKNISWDITSDDPTEALEYYNSLVEAREKLVLASENDESLLDTEIYEDLNTAINSMSESLDTYIEKLYEEEKLNYMAQNNIPKTTEEYKAMESALVNAAGSSVDLQDKFKELLTEDFTSLATDIENVGNVVKEVAGGTESIIPTLSLSQTIDQLNAQIKPAFDSLKSAWQDIFTDDGFALNSIDIISTCDTIKSKLDELNEIEGIDVDYSSFEGFIDVLNNSDSTADEVKESFNRLATSIAQAGISGAEDFETLKAALEDLGVVNNELVAFDALISNTEALKVAGLDLASATDKEIASFANEVVSAENVSQAIAMLTFQKELCSIQDMNTAGEVANLLTLAENAGYTGEVIENLTELEQIYQQVASGTLTPGQLDAKLARATELEDAIKKAASNIKYEPKVDFIGATKAAKSAGKEAGKSYKEGLEEELSNLNSVISGITSMIDDQINTIKSQKEIAVAAIDAQIDALNKQKSALEAQKKALEKERDARIEIIEQQKKQLQLAIKAIDKQIKQKEKVIKGIEAEIKAMKDANEQRKLQLNLQREQYELERLQHQRTILQYSSEKGMHYVTNTKDIRNQKDKVDDAKLEIEIANKQKQIDLIEKEIDLLNEKKDAINEQIELLDEQIDQINEYYDAQIKAIDKQIESIDKQIEAVQKQKEETEKYYESLIENLEKSKSKYEELTELVKEAEVSAALKKLGIDEEALLNGSEEEFQKLKDAYMDVVFKLNEGNAEVLESLQELSGYDGTAPAVLSDTTEKLDEMNTKLDNSTQNMDKLSTSATTASKGTSSIATSMGELGTNTEGISDNLTSINDALNELPETDKLTDLAAKFTDLGDAIQAVADVLGIGEDGAVSTLVSALNEISTISLDGGGDGEDGEGSGVGIISQFNNLKSAVEDVTNAISGGGSSGGEGGDASGSSSSSMSSGADREGASGLISAIEEIKPATNEALGGGGEGEDSEGEGSGAIPQFNQLKTAVDEVTAAIGTAESEGREGTGEGAESTTLIGALHAQYETASETIPETKALFEELLESIMACVSALNNMISLMSSMPEMGGTGGISVTPHAKGTVGNAFAKGTGGYKGLANREKNALVSEYGQPEMTVLPSGKTILTDKPTMMDLPKDTVIYNEEQTKKIMDNKVDVSGNAHADGTVGETLVLDDGTVLIPVQPDDKILEYSRKFDAYLEKIGNNVDIITNSGLFKHENQMDELVKHVNNNVNNVTNNKNVQPIVHQEFHITMPNVTDSTSATELMNDLQSISRKKFQVDW